MRLTTAALVMIALVSGAARATQGARGTAPLPRFEALSIREVPPDYQSDGVGLYWIGLRNPGLWRAEGQPLLFIVMAAYGLGQWERARISGVPDWGYTELFEIDGRVPQHVTDAQVPLMVQAMLAGRFKLKAHWEERRMRAVAMTVAPGGPKMQRDPACDNAKRPPSSNTFRFQGGIHATIIAGQAELACGTWSDSQVGGVIVRQYHGFTMQQLASLNSGSGQRPLLLDRTQLGDATFDFTLRARFKSNVGLTPEEKETSRIQAERDFDQIFREQLGLEVNFLKPKEMSVPVLIVDRVEKPTPN